MPPRKSTSRTAKIPVTLPATGRAGKNKGAKDKSNDFDALDLTPPPLQDIGGVKPKAKYTGPFTADGLRGEWEVIDKVGNVRWFRSVRDLVHHLNLETSVDAARSLFRRLRDPKSQAYPVKARSFYPYRDLESIKHHGEGLNVLARMEGEPPPPPWKARGQCHAPWSCKPASSTPVPTPAMLTDEQFEAFMAGVPHGHAPSLFQSTAHYGVPPILPPPAMAALHARAAAYNAQSPKGKSKAVKQKPPPPQQEEEEEDESEDMSEEDDEEDSGVE